VTAPLLQFRVDGLPRTQGSKRAFLTRNKDPEQRRAIMREQNSDAHAAWRRAVQDAASEARAKAELHTLSGPLRVVMLFALYRGQKPKYPRPIGKNSGDVSKLARAVEDACTGAGVWVDDCLITDERIVKDYPCERVAQNTPGVIVRVWHDVGPPAPSTGQIALLAEQDPK
jgi:Holliday junction resolvase RusA-like endonuclease